MTIEWDSTQITCDSGKIVWGKAPVIISASRSTDIPAFFSTWLKNRLQKGYVVWYNPFNQKPSYISFEKARAFIFWTKNPEPLMKHLNIFDDKNINYYFQYTLNDYEMEKFEPKVPKLEKRIETFKKLSKQIGKEKVIWRFDPLVVTHKLTPYDLLMKIWNIGNAIQGYTDKLVFSFVDVKAYKKVQNNFINETKYFSKRSVYNAELKREQIHEICEGLYKIKKAWKKKGWEIKIATCGEEINLDKYGIAHNKCIDDDLLRKLFYKDIKLMYFLDYGKSLESKHTYKNITIHNKQELNLPFENSKFKVEKRRKKNMKDTGQRKLCGCIYSKDIGMYNTCKHFCIYCYANTSKTIVNKNSNLFSDNSESIMEQSL